MQKRFLLMILPALFLFSCNKNDEGQHTVKYNISSGNTMNVSYTDKDGTLRVVSNVSSTWTYSFDAPGNGQIVKLIINSTNASDVGGSIDIDGQEAT